VTDDRRSPVNAVPSPPVRSAAAIRQGVGQRTGGSNVEDVDGRKLLATSVEFGRALRRAGLPIDLGAAIDFSRALTLVHIGDRDEVKAAGATIFIRRHDDLEIYDRVFEQFWRSRRMPFTVNDLTQLAPASEDQDASSDADAADGSRRPGAQPRQSPLAPSPSGESADDKPLDGIIVAPDAYSHGELIRHKEFERMSQAELRDAERLIDLLKPRLEERRTRRQELHDHGQILAPRAMFRRNLATGGDLLEWIWRRRTTRPRPLVVICDISGSMERQSRLLLRFVQAISGSAVRAESFVFSTRLTRVTRILRDRDRDRALAKVSEAVSDWAGGTRIGEALRTFNQKWARRVLRSGAVVVIVSDGWDRGDPAVVGREMARLQRSCHRLVWLNPLAGAPGYQPLAAGMQAAYPFIDDFLPAGTVASLERLGQVLAGGGPGRGGGRPHRRAGGAQLAREGAAQAAGPRRITPNPGAGKRLGAWASKAPATTATTAMPARGAPPAGANAGAAPQALANETDPSAPRPLR
jgi:uncharacterized protein with von Willebrand factor type A (vWA) domain